MGKIFKAPPLNAPALLSVKSFKLPFKLPLDNLPVL